MNRPVVKPWTVLKFGGSSLASEARWSNVRAIVEQHRARGSRVLVVCSAVSGVTDRLIAIADALDKQLDPSNQVHEIARIHRELARSLAVDPRCTDPAFASLRDAIAAYDGRPAARALVIAHGELLSTRVGAAYLGVRVETRLVDARTLLAAVEDGDAIAASLSARCPEIPALDARGELERCGADVVITQGFIVRGTGGTTALLGRGGSDASASYLAAAIGAAALEIWSDVPGLFSADPRIASDARLLRHVDYGEALALASLGAKALHPRTIEPCRRAGIELRLGWTEHPNVAGTRIGALRMQRATRGITARNDLALWAVRRTSLTPGTGLLPAIAAITSRSGLPIDLLASSPDEVRFTIDLAAHPSGRARLDEITHQLETIGHTTRWSKVGSVSAVGARELPRAFRDVHALLTDHAADGSHVTIVCDAAETRAVTRRAHAELFGEAPLDTVIYGARWSDVKLDAERRRTFTRTEQPCRAPA